MKNRIIVIKAVTYNNIIVPSLVVQYNIYNQYYDNILKSNRNWIIIITFIMIFDFPISYYIHCVILAAASFNFLFINNSKFNNGLI